MEFSAKSAKRVWVALALALVAIALPVAVALGDITTGTNTLTSATKSPNDRVTVVGSYSAPLHTSPDECSNLAGLNVTEYARDTTTLVVTELGTGTTTAGGAYSFEGATKIPVGTSAVYTIVQGRMNGPYGGEHGCSDATSNEITVVRT